MPVPLPDELLDLLGRPSLCFVATIMPDGSPQLTQTWVSTDGEHILINTPDHSQKARNVARDPRVAVNVADPGNTRRYFAVRGRVIATTTEGGAQSIDEISGKYLGRPYPNFSGRPETRMIMTIEADSVRGMGALAGMPCPPPLNSPLWSLRFVDVERPVPVRRLMAPGTLMRTSSPLAERAVVARFRTTSVHRSTWSACMRWPASEGSVAAQIGGSTCEALTWVAALRDRGRSPAESRGKVVSGPADAGDGTRRVGRVLRDRLPGREVL